MKSDEFRQAGYRLIDWVADYLDNAEEHPVVPDVQPGDIRRRLPAHPPEQPESMQAVIDDFERLILPGVTHWNHPRFFAYFPANHSGPSILGELLSAGLGVNAMLWQSCPAATELEQVVMDWLRQLLDLPTAFTGVIQDSASTATLCAVLCAREQATGFDFNQRGPAALVGRGPLRVYASSQAHSSVDKAVRIAGLGIDNLVRVGVDARWAMDPALLEQAIQADVQRGASPCCVVATLGTTSSTAIDPVSAIATIAHKHGLWLHVDAALAGSAAILPEMRTMMAGVEGADSFVFNPHKWLFVNFDCSAFYCQQTEVLQHTFSIMPEYLKTGVDDRVVNYRDFGIQLGRRFRALKLWFVLRQFGAEGLRALLRKHLRLAQTFADRVQESGRFELLAPSPLQTVCFRFAPADRVLEEAELERLNMRLLDEVNRSGQMFITHTRLGDTYCLRLSVGQLKTEQEHVDQAWQLLNDTAERLARQDPSGCCRAR